MRYVKVKATRQDLHDIGVCSEPTFDVLLSGKAFAVNEVRLDKATGKSMIYLGEPFTESHLIWVYEEMTENV